MTRKQFRSAVEDLSALDVRFLKRAGLLSPGRSTVLRWSQHGKVKARIEVIVGSMDSIRLRYRITTNDQCQTVDCPVRLEWTDCYLGGQRPWFHCPKCAKRVAKLYAGIQFACRTCGNYTYRIQQVSKRDVPAERSWRLRRALGCAEGFLFKPAGAILKPKGIHWNTFNRKVQLLRQLDQHALTQEQALLARMYGLP